MNKMEFKKGDEVYIKGVVSDGDYSDYPLEVQFPTGRAIFTFDGKYGINDEEPSLFHFPPTNERVVEVRDHESGKWVKRVFVKKIDNRYYCWENATDLESSERSTQLLWWSYMREIKPKRKVTIEEVAKLLNLTVDEIEL